MIESLEWKLTINHWSLFSRRVNVRLSAPKRLQRMMLRLQNFDFEVPEYKKGTLFHLADTLSRVYLQQDQISGSKADVFLARNYLL